MAIYHFSTKVISRNVGSSACASAAYRSAERLHDNRLERDHDFTNKPGVVHSEVITPDNCPEQFAEREILWNAVEAKEARKDAQLAREVEFAIPREFNQQQGIELARDFVTSEFTSRGMIADLNVHWDMAADGLAKPHAHVMLTMRSVDENGFGAKQREWNSSELLQTWRERWADHVNERLGEHDIEARIDHRSLADQGIDLEPQSKIGPAASRMAGQGLQSERVNDHLDIAHRNGQRIIADPDLALNAITRQQATFTERDLAMFVHRHSDGKGQFDQAMGAVQGSPNLVRLGKDGRDQERFTSKDMINVEERMFRAAEIIAERERHRVKDGMRERALNEAEIRGLSLSGEQRDAFDHVTQGKDLSVVVGYAGTGKSAMLGVARESWEQAGYQVHGVALSGIAAENLQSGSGIGSRTIASMEHQWGQGREMLTHADVLVVDEAGMVGSRQMERVLSHAAEAGAKVVLVGDPDQLQAIEAGAAFRAIHEHHGGVEITEIRRQQADWQREATRQLATERTGEALHSYDEHGHIHQAATREQAREELIDRWNADRLAQPDASRIILTHTNEDVRGLNESARDKLSEAGELGKDVTVQTERGSREFATGDRVMFLKNERSLGVKNGSLGEIETVSPQRITARLDDGRSVAFDTKDYNQIDHGYAATIHKSQGMTIDRSHMLATPSMDRHSTYVALSRHREDTSLHYGRDDFADTNLLARTLSRERAKDMASDYARGVEVEAVRGQEGSRTRAGEREPAQSFAARREIKSEVIRLPEQRQPIIEPPRKEPVKARSIFASFKPPVVTPERDIAARELRSPSVAPELKRAVEKYARTLSDISAMKERGLSVLPHQEQARDRAHDALNKIQPHAGRDAA
ncbi:MAG: Ti-type conjugative transfer relaxase TraA, partial [Alphaproteobacteria bacterium]|nr:Ti-type conjugative transfer relaxase TraA [Alphaproteobacteria bacterium]